MDRGSWLWTWAGAKDELKPLGPEVETPVGGTWQGGPLGGMGEWRPQCQGLPQGLEEGQHLARTVTSPQGRGRRGSDIWAPLQRGGGLEGKLRHKEGEWSGLRALGYETGQCTSFPQRTQHTT
jgi:hypothetical protein